MASPGQSSKEGKSKGGHTRGLRASEEHFGPGTGAESVPDLLLPKIRAGEGTFWAAAGATMGKPRLQNWTRGGSGSGQGQAPPTAATPGTRAGAHIHLRTHTCQESLSALVSVNHSR